MNQFICILSFVFIGFSSAVVHAITLEEPDETINYRGLCGLCSSEEKCIGSAPNSSLPGRKICVTTGLCDAYNVTKGVNCQAEDKAASSQVRDH